MADSSTIPSPRATRETGYAAEAAITGSWWSDLANEQTPELRWPLSIHVYDRMRRQDAQVSSVLRAVKSPIIRTQWRVDGSGCDEVVTRMVADNLGLPIVDDDSNHTAQLRGRDRFSWDEHLRLALLELDFGHMFFEQTYREPDDTSPYWRLRKLGPRFPRSISQIIVARDGGLVSIQQLGVVDGSYGTTKPIPVSQLVAYVMEREGGNWLGNSLLRSAYKNWLLKDRALRTWSTSIDRNGVGVPIYTAAEGEANLDAGEDLAKAVRSGDNAGGAIPNGAALDLLSIKGTLPDIEEFVQYHDAQIARSALGHFLNLGSQTNGQVGSYNLGSVFADTFHLGLDAVADQVATTASAHIVEDLVDINFGPTVPAPRLVYDPIGTRQTELDRVRETAGLSSDADLVKLLRTIPSQEAS